MKIAISHKSIDGPWGGGNRFIKSLKAYLIEKGHYVYEDLMENDLDIILLVDPRRNHPNKKFLAKDILKYLIFKNPNALVIHRINECDERKNTNFMNKKIRLANYCADHTVFVSEWLSDLNLMNLKNRSFKSVIRNGADRNIFNSANLIPWNKEEPFKFVTHHWGNNWMKGFDIYKLIDDYICSKEWAGKLKFTYIGNLPKNFEFKNVRYIKPLDGSDLVCELKKHHGYVTGSINEPGGNHQNEAALCGLPILYRNSGCLPEYCEGFGIPFSYENFESALKLYLKKYTSIFLNMKNFTLNSRKTNSSYLNLFQRLLSKREEIIKKRNLFRSPRDLIRNQIIIF